MKALFKTTGGSWSSISPFPIAGQLKGYTRGKLASDFRAGFNVAVLSFPVMSTTAMAMVDGRRMVLSHGHIFNEDSLPPAADIFLYGHTHIPVAHRKDGVICFNPGSAGIPKGGFPASYGEYVDGVLNVRSLDDDEVLMSIGIRS